MSASSLKFKRLLKICFRVRCVHDFVINDAPQHRQSCVVSDFVPVALELGHRKSTPSSPLIAGAPATDVPNPSTVGGGHGRG